MSGAHARCSARQGNCEGPWRRFGRAERGSAAMGMAIALTTIGRRRHCMGRRGGQPDAASDWSPRRLAALAGSLYVGRPDAAGSALQFWSEIGMEAVACRGRADVAGTDHEIPKTLGWLALRRVPSEQRCERGNDGVAVDIAAIQFVHARAVECAAEIQVVYAGRA